MIYQRAEYRLDINNKTKENESKSIRKKENS